MSETSQPLDYTEIYLPGNLVAKALDRIARTGHIVGEFTGRVLLEFGRVPSSDFTPKDGEISLNLKMGEIIYPDGSRQSFMDEKGIISKPIGKTGDKNFVDNYS